MAKKGSKSKKNMPAVISSSESSMNLLPEQLLCDIRSFIETAKVNIVKVINFELVLLHWKIGKRIRDDIIGEKRADYGKKVVEVLSKKLTMEYGKGFGSKSLFHMIKFAEVFPDEEIVSSLMRQLTWTHFLEVIYLKDQLQRDFYIEICRLERWSVRACWKNTNPPIKFCKVPF